VSWFPSAARGSAPASSYLLPAIGGALLVDPGLTVLEDRLIDQLRGLLDPAASLSVYVTRPAELDCIAATAAVLSSFPVTAVYAPTVRMSHRVGIQPNEEPPPERANSSRLGGGVGWIRIAPGDTIEVGAGPARRLEVVRAPLRMVACAWLYDAASRTLFSSDVFAHVVRPASAPAVLDEGDRDATSTADVRATLEAKFDFLPYTDTRNFGEAIAAVFEARDVEVVAPSYGCVLRGRAVVERHLELLLGALASFHRHRSRSAS
jgi:flavorubredoxin